MSQGTPLFPSQKPKVEIKDIFSNFTSSKHINQRTCQRTSNMKQFERGTGNASGANWEEAHRLNRKEVISIKLSRLLENVYLKERLQLEENEKRSA